MRFHGIMLLRDEGDVIGECLDHLLSWADCLYLLDTGSTDGTWDIVQDYAKRDARVVLVGRYPLIFSDNLRGWLFDRVRANFEPGDWCLRLDADEFYHVPPPQFVRECLRRGDSAVMLQWYYFRLTIGEAQAYINGQIDLAADRRRPIAQRRRFYKIADYPEPRMFKYRRGIQWGQGASFPYNAGFVARERIPIRHYPHRDPQQLALRYRLRMAMARMNPQGMGAHWRLDDWRKDLVDESPDATAKASHVGLSGVAGVDSGPLLWWKPGTPLEERPLYNHLPGLARRMAQRIVHPLLLPLLDARQPKFDPNFQPAFIPDDVNEAIGNEKAGDLAGSLPGVPASAWPKPA